MPRFPRSARFLLGALLLAALLAPVPAVSTRRLKGSRKATLEVKDPQAEKEQGFLASWHNHHPHSKELSWMRDEEGDQDHSGARDDLEDLEDSDSQESIEDGLSIFSRWALEDSEEESEQWSPWSPCSATCGNATQQRTRNCGFLCTATETATCDLPPCPGSLDLGKKHPLSDNVTAMVDPEVDSCKKWLECRSPYLLLYLQLMAEDLPSCPCQLPRGALRGPVHVRDGPTRRHFWWRLDSARPAPPARTCLRSEPGAGARTLAAQLCCYDARRRLLTRGRGAATAQLVSSALSPELHHKFDTLPLLHCKGDWSRYHAVRPPNNGFSCAANPGRREYLLQLREAQEY